MCFNKKKIRMSYVTMKKNKKFEIDVGWHACAWPVSYTWIYIQNSHVVGERGECLTAVKYNRNKPDAYV